MDVYSENYIIHSDLFFKATAENVFIAIFTFEMLLKIFAYGFVGYCRSLFNIFDIVVS